jgi:hypothetical protein
VGRRAIDVKVIPEVGVPLTVVNSAIARFDELCKAASRRTASSFDKNFSVWAVFDRDSHDCYYAAITAACQRGIRIAYSNPCIELWGLLHMIQIGDGPLDRHKAQRDLESCMPRYSHRTGAKFDFELMKDGYLNAVQRAIFLRNRLIEVDDTWGCPSTSMDRLTETLLLSARPPVERRNKSDEMRRRIQEIEIDSRFETGDTNLWRERSELLDALKQLA